MTIPIYIIPSRASFGPVADKRVQVAVGNVERAETGVWVRAISTNVRAIGLLRFYDDRKPREQLLRLQTKHFLPELTAAG